MNRFLALVDSGELASLEDLRGYYKTEVKRLHPDLSPGAPPVDFDTLKRDYTEALKRLTQRLNRAVEPAASPPPFDKGALLDEFRELVARGFPVNIQAASKNRAYAASIRRVTKFLEEKFGDVDFFLRANREARALKRSHPKAHWYVLQVFWSIGDWRLTGYDYYRRIIVRHRDFVRETLEEENYSTLWALLQYLTE